MTLPTGGVIRYDYKIFADSFGNNNQWLSHIYKDGGTTTFTPQVLSGCGSPTSCMEKFTVTSPSGNDTVYTFSLDKAGMIAGSSWVSAIASYQGSAASGTLLQTANTNYTYNTYTASALQGSKPISLGTYQTPATITNSVTLNDINSTSKTVTTLYGSTPLPSSTTNWDFGRTTPTTQTTYNYGAYNFPSSIVVQDGSGNQISNITYGYDESTPSSAPSGLVHYNAVSANVRGNQTSQHQWINTNGQTLTQTMTYDAAGVLQTSTDPSGMAAYGYDATDTFQTSTTPPTPSSGVTLSTSSTTMLVRDCSPTLPIRMELRSFTRATTLLGVSGKQTILTAAAMS